ncbi:MAG: tRNA lysidine(34) synthetase TilS, partial [Gammaproteobacteria bacterium]
MFNEVSLYHLIQTLDPNKTIWIAYSGGLDSQVLLHALSVLRAQISQKVIAVHINHQLSPNANDWQTFCKKSCEAHGITFKSFLVEIDAHAGESIENQARDARYEKLKPLLNKGDYLFTAHQQNDQAETLLLQLFRGAGVAGLAAMPKIKEFGQGYLVRPLLDVTREALTEYAKNNNLHWIEDEGNINPRFDRNYIRNEVLPIIKKKWPEV